MYGSAANYGSRVLICIPADGFYIEMMKAKIYIYGGGADSTVCIRAG